MGTLPDFLLWHFWPEGEPALPAPPDHLLDTSEAPTLEVRHRLFWEAYDRAREQGLPTLEARYHLLRERYEALQRRRAFAHWLCPYLRSVLDLLLEALARGLLQPPVRSDADSIVLEGLELSFEVLQQRAEVSYLKPHVRKIPNAWYQDGQPPVFRARVDRLATSLQYTFSFNGFPVLERHERGVLLAFSVDWWEGLPRPLRLVVHLPAPVEATRPEERAQAASRALDRALAPLDPGEESLLKLITWELAVVAAARWHLTLGIDPPRDRPDLLLSKKDRDLRARLLDTGRRVRQQALFELFQEAYKAENPTGLKKLPNLAWDRILEHVSRRLEELYVSPEQLGYRPEDFDPSTPGRVDRWRAWFDQRRRRARHRR